MSKPGSRDNKRVIGEQVSVDRFDMSNVSRDEDRVSMTHSLTLGGVKTAGDMYPHWFSDKDNRLEQAMAGGYEVVRDGTGMPIVRKKGMYSSYLMQLPMNLRQIDLDKKAQAVNNTIKKQNKLGDGEYLPGANEGRQHALERDRAADFAPSEIDNLA